jgi:penicillin-binding protein 1A
MTQKSFFPSLMAAAGSVFLSGIVVGCFVVLGVFYTFSRDLPDPAKLAKYEPPIITRLYANDGRLMAEYAKEHRIFLPLEAIPKRVTDAFLSAEDKNFYTHSGIDFFGLARAALTNLNNFGAGRSMVGGSTITQQVVKNFLLSNEKSFERKIKEAILAFRIDRIYSKNRILELYLNQIYLGSGSYGVTAAALNYFNKSLDELTIAEVAYLAALPKAPSSYDPARNYERAKIRRDWVIGRMLEDGKITEEEATNAEAAPIAFHKRDQAEVVAAPFFAEEVRRRLATMYGSDVLYSGGLFVKTTLNATLQDYADRALRHALVQYDRRHGYRGPVATLPTLENWQHKLDELTLTTPLFDDQELAVVDNISKSSAGIILKNGKKGAIPIEQMRWARRYLSETHVGNAVSAPKDVLMVGDVVLVSPVKTADGKAANDRFQLEQIPKVNGGLMVVEPHTGRILAITGGYSPLGTQFNRATQAKRQPGSVFKPFVYLAGLEAGYNPTSILWDSPISLPQGAGLPNWTPQNYSNDFLGPIPFRIGVEKSRNAMTVYLASRLGINRIRDMGKKMGIYKEMPAEYSAVLGSRETTLMALVNAYAMLVNGGKRVEASPIERIDDRYGKIIFQRDKRECETCQMNTVPPVKDMSKTPPDILDPSEQVIDPAVAYQMVSILQGVVERGTAVAAKSLGLPLGGKTGTTNDSRDTWFVGFSPDLVVGLYVGFDQPKSLGEKETGSSVALPGFIKFMELAEKGKPSRGFTIPSGIQLVKIDRWSGRPTYGAVSGNVILEAFRTAKPKVLSAPTTAEANSDETTEDAAENSAESSPYSDPRSPVNRHYPPDPQWQGSAPRQPAPPPAIEYEEQEDAEDSAMDQQPNTPQEDMRYRENYKQPQYLNSRVNRRHRMFSPNQGTGGFY